MLVNWEWCVYESNSPWDKKTFMSALEVSSFDKDELLSILDRFQCHRVPNTVEITDSYPHAHKAFIKEP